MSTQSLQLWHRQSQALCAESSAHSPVSTRKLLTAVVPGDWVGEGGGEGSWWRVHHPEVPTASLPSFLFWPNLLSLSPSTEHQKVINFAEQLINHLLVCKHFLKVFTCNPSRLSGIASKQIDYCLPKDFGEYNLLHLIMWIHCYIFFEGIVFT